MTLDNDKEWNLPSKEKGKSLQWISIKIDPIAVQAIDHLAALESTRIGKNVSRGTVITDLLFREGSFQRTVEVQLRRIYRQLKRGNQMKAPQPEQKISVTLNRTTIDRVDRRLRIQAIQYTPKRRSLINQPLNNVTRSLQKALVWTVIQ